MRSQRTVVCKCRTHCTVWDQNTQRYVGKGKHISRGTKHNHSRDDRRMSALRKRSNVPVTINRLSVSLISLSRLQERRHWVRSVEIELAVLYQDPIAPLIRPLVFCKDPRDNLGRPDMDWRTPNEGDHALKENSHSNVPFLHLEHRLSYLMSTAMEMRLSKERTSVIALLEAAHYRLNNEKTLHWLVQHTRSGATSGNIAHTGKCQFGITALASKLTAHRYILSTTGSSGNYGQGSVSSVSYPTNAVFRTATSTPGPPSRSEGYS